MSKITNRQLAKLLKEESNNQYNMAEFLDMFDLFAMVMEREVLKGNEVHIHGLGTFSPQKKKAYRMYMGLKGEWLDVPETLVVKFKPSAAVKARVQRKARKILKDARQSESTEAE